MRQLWKKQWIKKQHSNEFKLIENNHCCTLSCVHKYCSGGWEGEFKTERGNFVTKSKPLKMVTMKKKTNHYFITIFMLCLLGNENYKLIKQE